MCIRRSITDFIALIGTLVATTVITSGCMSQGGMPMVGPLSALHAAHADKAKMTRAASMHVPAEKRESVIKALAMEVRPGDIAVGYQVDIAALFNSNYTWGEVGMQALAATGDIAAEVAAAKALSASFSRDSHDVNISVSGNAQPVYINSGTQPVTVTTSNNE